MLQAEYRDLIEEYVQAVKAHFGRRLVSVCFFGSVARGEASTESDVDALIVAEGIPKDVGSRVRNTSTIHESIRRGPAYHNLRSAGRSAFISDLYFSPEEVRAHPPILLDIADHGVIAYDREGFLAGVLEEIRQRLMRLGARKVTSTKGYYWILKPDAKPTEVIEV